MAKVKIQGHASGTGILTVTAPNTSTDRTITLPDATGTLLNSDGDGSNLTGLSSFDPDGAVTINDTGADVDFRVESDTSTHALFLQGSDGAVGIGTSSPDYALDIEFPSHGGARIKSAGSNADSRLYLGTTGTTGSSSVNFGDDADDDIGQIRYNHNGNSLEFKANGSEHMRITSDGRGLSQFTAKAWINFNGTGTIATRDSHNVSSIADSGTGNYQVNLTNAMANTNYCVTSSNADWNATAAAYPNTTSQIQVWIENSNANADTSTVEALVFGD